MVALCAPILKLHTRPVLLDNVKQFLQVPLFYCPQLVLLRLREPDRASPPAAGTLPRLPEARVLVLARGVCELIGPVLGVGPPRAWSR